MTSPSPHNPFPTRRLLPALLAAGALVITGCQSARHTASATQSRESQASITPALALERLKAGNQRFVEGRPLPRNLAAQRQSTAAGQFPFAVVLSCLDSRTSTEQIFDLGIGDVFNARVAGNVLNDDILGSMEFACAAAGARLIAVVGHTSCGAVKGACEQVKLGHLSGLLEKIQPAVARTPSSPAGAGAAYVDAVSRNHVKLVMSQIRERSQLLADLIQSGKVGLVGGMYDLETGRVEFFD